MTTNARKMPYNLIINNQFICFINRPDDHMSSTLHGIFLHAVFSTKFRAKLIDETWADELYAYMGGVAADHKTIVLCSGGIEDHVHLLLKIHPSFAISDTMRLLKANSSRWINEKQQTLGRFEWQRGYGAFSVSHSQVKKVQRYIKNQRQHHKYVSFKEEYLAILQKHEIQYDERFVFDEEIVD